MARFVFEDDPRFVLSILRKSPSGPSAMKSFWRGAAQGATLGFGDEVGGAIQAILPPPGGDPRGYLGGMLARYREQRDAFRRNDEQAYQAHPVANIIGNVTGSVPLAFVTGGSGATRQGMSLGARVLTGAKTAAPLGAAYGAGASKADSPGGVALDAVEGGAGAALFGGAAPAVGAGIRRVLGPISRKGAEMVAKGTQRAQQQAAEEATQAVASIEGAARERAANAYRQMERIEASLKNPATPAPERAALEAFKASPEYASLVEANAKGILAAAPGAAAEREAAAAIASQARQDLPQTIQSRAKELLTPQVRADVASFLRAYAEPVVWAYGGNKLGELAGLSPDGRLALAGAAGLIGGRTRAGKALMSRLTRPAHQVAIGNALRSLGSIPSIPPRATQAAAVGLDPELAALVEVLRGGRGPGLVPAVAEEDQ